MLSLLVCYCGITVVSITVQLSIDSSRRYGRVRRDSVVIGARRLFNSSLSQTPVCHVVSVCVDCVAFPCHAAVLSACMQLACHVTPNDCVISVRRRTGMTSAAHESCCVQCSGVICTAFMGGTRNLKLGATWGQGPGHSGNGNQRLGPVGQISTSEQNRTEV